MTLGDVLQNCTYIVPELILIATLCAVILTDVLVPMRSSGRTGWLALGGLVLALLAVLQGYGDHPPFATPDGSGPLYAFSGMIVIDSLSDFFKTFFIGGTIAVVLFSISSVEIKDYRKGEYYTLILGSVTGASLLVSSNNLLMMLLSLETLSLCSYVLAGYIKHNKRSAEASIKYILYGSVASGVMLFGISYLYGMAGTLDISKLLVSISYREDNGTALLLAFVLVISGLAFKMAAVPFHFWAPDVYEGAPTPITAFLAVVSKAAGFSIALRLFLPLFASQGSAIPDDILAVQGPLRATIDTGGLPILFWVLSVASMTVGNLVALRQTDIKRMLAYSSIAHAGYLLMGLTVFNQGALEGVLLYFVVYFLMNLGAFLVVILMINKTGSADLKAYRGLIWRNPLIAVCMIGFLVSLTGIPPTLGFVGKWALFNIVIAAGSEGLTASGAMTTTSWLYFSLALIAGINTAISLYYYMNVVKVMVFEQPEETSPLGFTLFDNIYLLVFFIPVTFMIIQFSPLLRFVDIFGG